MNSFQKPNNIKILANKVAKNDQGVSNRNAEPEKYFSQSFLSPSQNNATRAFL
jgi:hypothetical protein